MQSVSHYVTMVWRYKLLITFAGQILWDAGVDLLNVDDLEGAANFWENMG